MDKRCLYVFSVALLATLSCVFADHFRGGSMSWKPITFSNTTGKVKVTQVLVTYQLGYRYDFTQPGHDKCTPEAWHYGTELETNGKLICEGCNKGNDVELTDLSYYCHDYDTRGNWATGGNTFVVDVPGKKREFDVSYQDCCWLRPLASHPLPGRGWKMLTHVNVKPRPDNGLPNSSPISSPLPVQTFQQGCHYTLQIPVTDPENDVTRCRIASRKKGECNSNPGHDRVCGETPYVSVHDNCTLSFDTTGDPGYYAVTVIIEDFIDEEASKPMSSVSLLFLLKVEPSSSCTKPRVLSPPHGTCKTIPADDLFTMDVVVEAGDPTKPISQVMTIKPPGMEASTHRPVYGYPDRRAITLTWTPSANLVGRHTVCYSALDSDNFSSGMSCIILNVADIDNLEPVLALSTPSDAGNVTLGEKWVIAFNTEIRQPTSPSYISVVDDTGNIILRLDTSTKSNDVTFVGRSIEFYPQEDAFVVLPLEVKEYQLRLDQGAAISVGSCGMDSEAFEWSFDVVGPRISAATNKPPLGIYVPPPSAIPQCFSSSMEIFVSKHIVGEIDPSLMHLNDPSCTGSHYNETHYVIGTGYGLCGTTVEVDQVEDGGRQIIQNIVHIPPQPYTNDSIITRDHIIEIHVTCNLTTKRYTYAEFDPDVKTIIYHESGYGNFNFTLRMLHDDGFTLPYKLKDFPVDVDLNQKLYFEARSWAKASMMLHLESCRATPTSNPFDPRHYTFIENGCAVDDTVQFHESGNLLRKRFSIDAFAFLGKQMHGSVFVHCDMRLCDSRNPNSRCARGCLSDPGLPKSGLPSTIIFKRDVRGVARRDVISDEESLASTEAYQETDGPINIVQADSGVPTAYKSNLFNWDLVEVILIGCVILLLVVLIALQLLGVLKRPASEKTIAAV